MILLLFSRQQLSPSRSLSRSFSDPSSYKAPIFLEDGVTSENDLDENEEVSDKAKNGDEYEGPWKPRERASSK